MTNPEKKFETWLENLKIGDIVCDCRYKHLKIVEKTEDRFVYSWITRPLYWCLPLLAADWIEARLESIKLLSAVYDKQLKLEDGTMCSARYCCSPPDHEYTHPMDADTK